LMSRARKIYTFHGFSTEFARSLKGLGLDAEPVARAHKPQPSNASTQKSGTLDVYLQA
jgi:hypothetical protein